MKSTHVLIRSAAAVIAIAGSLMLGIRTSHAAESAPTNNRTIQLTGRYLNFLVKTGAPKRRVTVALPGGATREFELELAQGQPGFWVFLDVGPWVGGQAQLSSKPDAAVALAAVECLDYIKGAENLYDEALRPQIHFSSRRGWNNDPNGMVYFKGEYHLYYQHNPYGWDWGNMHWGHAVSKDLVHWTELPIALYPRRYDDWAFSGSTVVDWKNTAGFQKGSQPALVLAYTSTGRGECIAYSHDKGRTWTEYAGNPVVKHQGRDPRLLWHEPSRQWVMALYDEAEKGRWINFYTSPDMKAWTYQSRIAGFYECPDFVELPVDGAKGERKWVLSGASSEYMVGSFDGKKFTPETSMLTGHRGNAFYAAQTFSDIPARDGRCVQIGWGRVPTPAMPFNQMMFLPTVMTLKNTSEGPRVAWVPVKEISKLRGRKHKRTDLRMDGRTEFPLVKGPLLELNAEFTPRSAREVVISLSGAEIIYNVAKEEIMSMGVTQRLPMREGKVRLHAILDKTSLEIFGDDGLLYMPLALKAAPPSGTTFVASHGGPAEMDKLLIYELKSSWTKAKGQ